MIEFSPLESRRFGLNCFRFQTNRPINYSQLNEELIGNQVDLLILRADVQLIEELHQLNQFGRYGMVFADALVYYQAKLTENSVLNLRNSTLRFELIDSNSVNVLNDLVPIIFSNYRNHYFSNPILDKGLILEGYQEWAKSYINQEDSERISWLVYKENEIAGFATCSMSLNDRSCEGVLYGVHPSHSGGGIYADIIRFTKHHFAQKGFQKMIVSTQLQNMAVQKVWQREGFEISNAYYTFHLVKK